MAQSWEVKVGDDYMIVILSVPLRVYEYPQDPPSGFFFPGLLLSFKYHCLTEGPLPSLSAVCLSLDLPLAFKIAISAQGIPGGDLMA